jgi:hypothetical protein
LADSPIGADVKFLTNASILDITLPIRFLQTGIEYSYLLVIPHFFHSFKYTPLPKIWHKGCCTYSYKCLKLKVKKDIMDNKGFAKAFDRQEAGSSRQ